MYICIILFFNLTRYWFVRFKSKRLVFKVLQQTFIKVRNNTRLKDVLSFGFNLPLTFNDFLIGNIRRNFFASLLVLAKEKFESTQSNVWTVSALVTWSVLDKAKLLLQSVIFFRCRHKKLVDLSFRITVSPLKHDYYYWHELLFEIIQSYLFESYSCIRYKMLDHLFHLSLSIEILPAMHFSAKIFGYYSSWLVNTNIHDWEIINLPDRLFWAFRLTNVQGQKPETVYRVN